MVHYFYKNNHKSLKSYIKCHWLNSLDFSKQDSITICNITLTDGTTYWSGAVTRDDLDNFVKDDRAIDELNKVVVAGLQGKGEYDGQPLKWKVTTDRNKKCTMGLITYMNGKLPYELGHFKIPVVSEKDKPKVVTQWLEDTVDQCSRFMTVQEALIQRNNDLCEVRRTMEQQIESMENAKIDADVVLIQQFKEILNRKKRRIRQVIKERDRLKSAMDSTGLATEEQQRRQQQPEAVTAERASKRKKGKQPKSQPIEPLIQSGSETDDDEYDNIDDDEVPKTRRKVIIPR